MTRTRDDAIVGQRILIIGSGGSGKSTLSGALGEILEIEPVHLDAHYWQPGWEPLDPTEWRARLAAIMADDRWILDGNFSSTLVDRLRHADTVILLDFSRWRCLWRVLRRWRQHRGRTRPSMAPGCPEHVSLEFLRWILRFPEQSLPRMLAALESFEGRVWRLRHPREVKAFLESLVVEGARGRRSARTPD